MSIVIYNINLKNQRVEIRSSICVVPIEFNITIVVSRVIFNNKIMSNINKFKKYVFTPKRQDPEPGTSSSPMHESKFTKGIYIIIIICKIQRYYTRCQMGLYRLYILMVINYIDFIISYLLVINQY